MSKLVIISVSVLIIFTIRLTILAVNSAIAMSTLEFIIWMFCSLLTIFLCMTWFYKKKQYTDKEHYDTKEVITLYALPRTVIAQTTVLIIFLFVNINKLNLLWIYPFVYYLISYAVAKRVVREDEDRMKLKG